MRKNVKKVIAPLLAAAMALSCTVCVSAAEDETIKLTVWGAEEDQNLLKELTDKFQEKYAQTPTRAALPTLMWAVVPRR